jgi:ABC-type transport system involved in multi-copper enzyme maturation permease subunit
MSITLAMTGRTLRRGASGTLALAVAIFLFEFVQPLVADSVGGGAGIAPLLEQLPPAFQAIIRTRPEFIAMSGLAGYLSLGLTHPIFYVLSSALLAALICRSIAGEYDSGTMQLALARPVARGAVYVSRVVASVVAIAVVVGVTVGGMLTGIAVGRPEGEVLGSHIAVTAAAIALLLWAIAGVALLLASLAATTSQAVGWVTAFIVVSYVIDYLAGFWSVIAPFDVISIHEYYHPAEALVTGALPGLDIAVLGVVGTLAGVAGSVIFRRRDLPS